MKKILIYNSGGGLGDPIQLFPLLISLKSHFRKSKFFYLETHKSLQWKIKRIQHNFESFDLGLKYFGFRWWHIFFAKKDHLKKL